MLKKLKDMRISRKLLIAFGILVLLATTISSVSLFSLQKLLATTSLVSSIQKLNSDLLQLNLMEKNFILLDTRNSSNDSFFKTGNSQYLKKYRDYYNDITINLAALKKNPIIGSHDLLPSLQKIQAHLINYGNYFGQFVILITKAGFKDWGLEGRLRDAIHAVEKSPEKYDKAGMLMLRRNEKDYFLRRDLQYQDQLHKNADIFITSIKNSNSILEVNKQKLIELVKNYVAILDQEIELHKIIGLTPTSGLMGNMNREFSKIELEFVSLKQQITQIEQVTYQRTIALLTELICLTFLIGGILTWLMTRVIANPIKKLYREAEKFNKGNLDVHFDVCSQDEIGKLSQTIINQVEAIRNLSNAAQKIGEGSFDVSIDPRSDEDVLSLALLRMKQNLQQLDSENKCQLWIKTNIAKITDLSQGLHDLQHLSQTVIRELATILNAGYGLFYIVSHTQEAEELKLLGSYAYVERKNVSNRFLFGEGLIGQCALEKKPILLTEVPADYIHITSGLGEQTPLTIFVMPILNESQVLGVIELGSFHTFTQSERDFVDGLAQNLGIIINNVISYQKAQDLLKASQTLTEELQTQQEELRTTNEELEEKTNILKESQNKLKEQSDELQSANEELEENTEKLVKQNLAIEQQNKDIELAKQKLEQRAKDLTMASKYKSEFLANMSHELRTPLNSLLILSKNLQENKQGNLTPKQVEAAKVIYNGGHELLTLINDILDLSKVEAGRLQLNITEVNVKQVCNGLKTQFEPIAKEKNLPFNIQISSNVPENIISDEQRLLQIIKNLLSNAFKFTSQGSVTLSIAKPNDTITFRNKLLHANNTLAWSVVDTGIGIPKEKQDSIFEAFQQADGSTSRTYGGTGLGLTISRTMSLKLGGEVSLSSEPNKGSIFTLYLPIEYIEVKDEGQPSQKPIHDEKPLSTQVKEEHFEEKKLEEIALYLPDDREKLPSEQKSLLIIEDDKEFAKILMEQAKEKGYLSLAAEDGRSGFALAKTYQPSAIILDLGLPDVNGLDVLEQIKYDLKTRHIPVHIISSQDETPATKQKGAIGFLSKPASTEAISLVFNKIESVTDNKIKHVLLVEDDTNGQKAIFNLIDNPHIKIDCISTAKDAKDKISQQAYDCMILDLNLPDQSGFDLLKDLSREKLNLPPVIIYTARDLTENEHNALQRYAASIIVKGQDSPDRLLDEVSLFLHSVESDLPEEKKKKIQLLHDPKKILTGKRVLLVDDDMRNVFALSSILEEHGIDVLIASNGKLALVKLEEEKNINLILMDIMMPIMDGYETMKEIRNKKQYKNIPIIALTAKAMTDDKEKCLKAGANDYITKPVDTDQLLSMMRVWLSHSQVIYDSVTD